MMHSGRGKFKIRKRKNGMLYFTLSASNGQVLMISEDYSSKSGVDNGIMSVRKHAYDALVINTTKKNRDNGGKS